MAPNPNTKRRHASQYNQASQPTLESTKSYPQTCLAMLLLIPYTAKYYKLRERRALTPQYTHTPRRLSGRDVTQWRWPGVCTSTDANKNTTYLSYAQNTNPPSLTHTYSAAADTPPSTEQNAKTTPSFSYTNDYNNRMEVAGPLYEWTWETHRSQTSANTLPKQKTRSPPTSPQYHTPTKRACTMTNK